MEAIVENSLIILKGLPVHEVQQVKEALRTLKQQERWMMRGEKLHSNIVVENAIEKVQMEWAKTQ